MTSVSNVSRARSSALSSNILIVSSSSDKGIKFGRAVANGDGMKIPINLANGGKTSGGSLSVRIDGKDFQTKLTPGEDNRMALARFVNKLASSGYHVRYEPSMGAKASISITRKAPPPDPKVEAGKVGVVAAGTSGLDIARTADGNKVAMTFSKNGKDVEVKDGTLNLTFKFGNETFNVTTSTTAKTDPRAVMTDLNKAILAKGLKVNAEWKTDGVAFSVYRDGKEAPKA